VDRLAFFRRIRPTYLWTTFFQPYPGVALTQNAFVREHMPEDGVFQATLHHDMYLDLPDRNRLVNLKKVYYLCVLSKTLTPLLVWLTRFRIPWLFDLLFMSHFVYYILKFERPSARQLLTHFKVFGINPLRRAGRCLHSTGAPFAPGRSESDRAGSDGRSTPAELTGEASALA
jgi:hypothetical protein